MRDMSQKPVEADVNRKFDMSENFRKLLLINHDKH